MTLSIVVLALAQSAYASSVTASSIEGGFASGVNRAEAVARATEESETRALEWCVRYLATRCDAGQLVKDSVEYKDGKTTVRHCIRQVRRRWSCATESTVSCSGECSTVHE